MWSQTLQDFGGVNHSAGLDISLGAREGRVEGFPVLLIKPVSGVEWQQLHLGALRQTRGFVHNQPAGQHAGLDRHGARLALVALPNKPLQPASGGCIRLLRMTVPTLADERHDVGRTATDRRRDDDRP